MAAERCSREGFVIGVTGAPGSGKTAVAGMLTSLGAKTVALDEIGHACLEEPEVCERIKSTFSSGVFRIMDGKVSREKLADVVFRDGEELEKLNCILHPRMVEHVREEIAGWRGTSEDLRSPAFVIDGALLVEMGLAEACDRVVLVRAPREERLSRLRDRRGWDEEEALRREQFQDNDESRAEAAHVIIDNSSGLDELHERVKALWEDWK